MSRAHKALAILVVSTLGLWGCAKGPGGSSQERIKILEAKVSRLEGDVKLGETAREQLRKKLAAAEEQLSKLQKDRDELEKTLTARTSERDTLQTQYEQFRKNLRELLGSAEASAPRYLPPVTTTAAAAAAPSPITPSTAPTSTVLPASTRISLSVPAAGANTSSVTLSVSSSRSGSSTFIGSPTPFIQSTSAQLKTTLPRMRTLPGLSVTSCTSAPSRTFTAKSAAVRSCWNASLLMVACSGPFSSTENRERYQIDGSKATLEIEYGPSSFSSTDPFRMRLYEQGGSSVHDVTRHNNIVLDEELRTSGRYKVEIEHFCECVLSGSPPLTSGLDGRKAIEAINAVYLSAYLGEKVHLPLASSPDLERLFAEMKLRSPRAD